MHAAYVRARAAQLVARRQEHGPGLAYGDYDAIAGLAGEGRGLLLAADHGDERCAQALGDVLDFLVGITTPCDRQKATEPRCRAGGAPPTATSSRATAQVPGGDCNVGVAHGICGPLALLSLAHRSGHRVPGMQDAIRRMADWVLSMGYTDGGRGMQWPGRVALPERPGKPSRARTTHPSRIPPALPGSETVRER